MFCGSCGKQIPEDAKFCGNCGNKVVKVEENVKPIIKTKPVLKQKLSSKVAVIVMFIGIIITIAALNWEKVFDKTEKTSSDIKSTSNSSQKSNLDNLSFQTNKASKVNVVIPNDTAQTIFASDNTSLTIEGGTLKKSEEVFFNPLPLEGFDENKIKPLSIYDVNIGKETKFDKELIISFPYNQKQYNDYISSDEQLVAAYKSDNEDNWTSMPVEIDKNDNRINIKTNHLCLFMFAAVSKDIPKDKIKEKGYLSDLINSAAAAYDSAKGEVGKAWKSAKVSFSSVLNGANDEWNFTGISDAYNNGECYVNGKYHIYFKTVDADEASKIYKSSINNKQKLSLQYGVNYYKMKNGQKDDSYGNSAPSALPLYVEDVISILDSAEKAFNKFQIPNRELTVVLYKATTGAFPFYDKNTDVLSIPMNDTSTKFIQQNVSHELFHYIETSYFNVLGMTVHKWLTEASAEYASLSLYQGDSVYKTRGLMAKDGNDIYKFTDYGAVDTGTNFELEYRAANVIEYLVKEKNINLPDLFKYYKEKAGYGDTDAYIVGSYLDTIDKSTPFGNFTKDYSDYIMYNLIGNSPALPNIDAFADFNCAENKVFPEDKTTKNITNSLGNTGYLKPSIAAVRLEVGSEAQGKGKQFEFNIKTDAAQYIYVYEAEPNQRLSSIQPVAVIDQGKTQIFSRSYKKTTNVYFVAMSYSGNASLKDNIVITPSTPLIGQWALDTHRYDEQGNRVPGKIIWEITNYNKEGYDYKIVQAAIYNGVIERTRVLYAKKNSANNFEVYDFNNDQWKVFDETSLEINFNADPMEFNCYNLTYTKIK